MSRACKSSGQALMEVQGSEGSASNRNNHEARAEARAEDREGSGRIRSYSNF